MTKQEYVENIEKGLLETLNDYLFNNYRNQVIARKLSSEFTPRYREDYLWSKLLYLSTNACILLTEKQNIRLATRCLKVSAETYENLSSISEKYDKDYCLILASLCYDVAGFQANALCLIKTIGVYEFVSDAESVELSSENYILFHIQQILLKRIFSARTQISIDPEGASKNLSINKFFVSWYENILNGSETDFYKKIGEAYQFYLFDKNIPMAHVLFLLKARVDAYLEKSIWGNLNKYENIKNSPVWTKYIKLLTHDVYDRNELKEAGYRTSRFEFWTSQLRAIQSGLLETGGNYVIQMPTSAGKTFIAEIAILDALVKFPGKKCVYVAPFRALTNEKEAELSDYLSKLGYSVSALSGSYELDEFQQIILEDTDVLVATPEKIDLLLRLNPNYFNEISIIVVDEGHIVGDISARASLVEFLLIRLRIKIPTIQTLFISAVMPIENADEYSMWLSGRKDRVIRSLLHADSEPDDVWEPTRKLIGSFEWNGKNGRIDYRDINTEDEDLKVKQSAYVLAVIKEKQYFNTFPNKTSKPETTAALALELSKHNSTLVFCARPIDTRFVGNALLRILENDALDDEQLNEKYKVNVNTASYFYASKWYAPDSYILRCISRGIGIHFGDLPEPVRTSVESDFRAGRLKLLLATNTISQGINFPIKNIIINSTIINQGETISIRDFWNLVGRAGRAGKETEGQILFIINSPTDRRSYDKFLDKTKLEPAFSLFYNVLLALINHRISEEVYENNIRILAESYLLNLLAEESVETDTQAVIEKIIDNSLFKVQLDVRNMDVAKIRNSFATVIKTIQDEVEPGLMKVYGETGLSLSSNKAISDFIDLNNDLLLEVIKQDGYMALLEQILTLFDNESIGELFSEKLQRIGVKPSLFLEVTMAWINGEEILELQKKWLKINDDVGFLNILISDGYYYRYTWVATSFITILLHKFEIERDNLPEGIKNLPSYIKYGLNNPTACLARSMGIKNRDVALILAQASDNLNGRAFIRWLANVSIEDCTSLDLGQYDTENVLNVAVRLSPNRYNEIPTSFEFNIKGTSFEASRRLSSIFVSPGDVLGYARDPNNQFDPFAIKIFSDVSNEEELGFVPREFSKVISVEIDINAVEYEIIATKIELIDDHNLVTVKMRQKV